MKEPFEEEEEEEEEEETIHHCSQSHNLPTDPTLSFFLFPSFHFIPKDQLQLPESNLMGAQTLGTYDASVGSPEALAASCKWRDLLIA